MYAGRSDSLRQPSLRLAVVEHGQVGDARRAAVALAVNAGLDEAECGAVAIVVTEAATNLVRHAQGGELVLRPLERNGSGGVELLALDRGPGMADVGLCLRDGYSTAGTSGTGLGAMSRLSSLFDVHSSPGAGTAILCRFWPRRSGEQRGAALESGMVCLPKPGESACGDGWAVEGDLVLLADGLGHGPEAAAAALEAIRACQAAAGHGPLRVLEAAHRALHGTRGAAAAVAQLELDQVRYAGIGNIAGAIVAAAGRHGMVSHNGTVGFEVRNTQEFVYLWPDDAILVLHSDGLATPWRLDPYPGLVTKHPGLIAGVLYRDFARGSDDVTILVARKPQSSHRKATRVLED